MKLLFIHGEEKIKEDKKGNFYTDGSYTENVWNRYEQIAEDITVMFRKEEKIYLVEEAKSKFQPFNTEKYKFIELEDIYKSIKAFINITKRQKNRKEIKKNIENSDIVIIRLPSEVGYLAAQIAKRCKKKYLLEVVGCPRDALWNHSFMGKILAPFSYLKMRETVKKAPYVIYVTNNFLQKRYKTRGIKFACSDVDLPYIDEAILAKRINKIEQYSKKNTYKFGLIGSLDVNYKGHELAIKGLAMLKNKINFELHFLGTGNKEKWIKLAQKYKVEDKVFFDGALPHNEVFKWMDQLDIYLILSKTEGMPRALIEAMSRACPCIGTDVGEISELLNKDLIINKNDYLKLSKIIEEILNNKEKMQIYANENFKKAKNYQEKRLNKIKKEYYMEILERLKNDKSITCRK